MMDPSMGIRITVTQHVVEVTNTYMVGPAGTLAKQLAFGARQVLPDGSWSEWRLTVYDYEPLKHLEGGYGKTRSQMLTALNRELFPEE